MRQGKRLFTGVSSNIGTVISNHGINQHQEEEEEVVELVAAVVVDVDDDDYHDDDAI